MHSVLSIAVIAAVLIMAVAGPAFAQDKCTGGEVPAVIVTFDEGDVDFDVMQDREVLAEKAGALSPAALIYGGVEVGGVMEGGLSLSHRVSYQRHFLPGATDEKTAAGCVRFTEIEVTVHIDPKIYIAQEVQDDSCMVQEIYRHELKHIEKDRTLFLLYESRIKEALALVFSRPDDYVSDVVPAAGIDGRIEEMNGSIAAALTVILKSLAGERAEAQKDVDSFDEYLRLSIACPGFNG